MNNSFASLCPAQGHGGLVVARAAQDPPTVSELAVDAGAPSTRIWRCFSFVCFFTTERSPRTRTPPGWISLFHQSWTEKAEIKISKYKTIWYFEKTNFQNRDVETILNI